MGSLAYIGNWCVRFFALHHTTLTQALHPQLHRSSTNYSPPPRKAIYDRGSSKNGNGDKPAPFTKETGRVAWLLWRSAYFTRTLSVRNKILVPFYWFLNCEYLVPVALLGLQSRNER